MIFEYPYNPVIEDFEKGGVLSFNAIMKIFENAGSGHSDWAGYGVFSISGLSKGWVLTDWQIEVFEYPKHGDKILAQTWSEGLSSPLVANRNFLLYKNGEVCARGTSRWIIIDFESGRPTKIEPAYLEKYGVEDKTVFDEKKLTRIPTPETWTAEVTLPVRRADIDFNNHVHNLTYLDYAMELLPAGHYKNMRIAYKTGLKDGSSAKVSYAQVDGAHIVNICDGEGPLACQLMFS